MIRLNRFKSFALPSDTRTKDRSDCRKTAEAQVISGQFAVCGDGNEKTIAGGGTRRINDNGINDDQLKLKAGAELF